MLQNDPWADFPDAEQAPRAPAPVGFIPGAPTPKTPPAQTPTQAAIDEATLAEKRQGLSDKQDKAAARESASAAHLDYAKNVIRAINEARGNISGWSTGLPGQILNNVGGTQAHNLRSMVDTVVANVGFDRLQQMRAESPTGGALGQVSDFENRMLQSSLANLQQSQSQDQFEKNLDAVELHYLNVMNTLQGKPPAQTLDEARVPYTIDPKTIGDNQRPDDASIKGQRLTPEQDKEWHAFLATGPQPGEVVKWWRDHGFGDPTNAMAVSAAAQHGRVAGGVNYNRVDEAARAKVEAELNAEDKVSSTGSEAPLNTLVQTGMTLGLRDEAKGVGSGLSHILTGRDPVEGYLLGRDAERLRQDRARERAGWFGTGVEFAGGLMSANPGAALAPIASRAGLIGQGARSGATGGALAGYGYGEGTEDSATSALLGAGGGALVGGGISAIASRSGGMPSQVRLDGPELFAAAERQGVTLNAANVRPGARGTLSYLESSPGSSGPVQRNLADQASTIEARTAELGANGTVLSELNAGQSVRGAGERFITRTRGIKDRMYDAAEREAKGTQIQAGSAVQKIQQRIQTLQQTPNTNQSRIEALQEILADISNPDGSPKQLSVEAMRALRSGVRSSLKAKGLTLTPAEADTTAALGEISDDIAAQLKAANPKAARLYDRADAFYRQRQGIIKDTLQRVLGPRDNQVSGEKVFANIQAMAGPKGDATRLAKVMSTLNPDERFDIAATIADRLGRAKPEDNFSVAHFVSQTANISPGARRIFFGQDGAEAIADLQRIATSTRDVQRKLNNSNSGRVMNYRSMLTSSLMSLIGAGGGGAAAGIPGAVAGAAAGKTIEMGGRRISATVLLSPQFTKWLARAPKYPTQQAMQAHIRQLGGLGRNTPIAADMQQIQAALQKQFLGTGATADPEEQKNP